MKKNINKKAIIFSTIACAAFLVSVQFSNSNKAVLMKGNIEAISESANGNDPGGALEVKTCFTEIKKKNNESVYQCDTRTGTFDIYPCNSVSNYTSKWLSPTKWCYKIPD